MTYARPYGKCFTRTNILKWWQNVGFLPMTRSALNNPKVRFELGDSDVPEEAGKRLALLKEAYRETQRSFKPWSAILALISLI